MRSNIQEYTDKQLLDKVKSLASFKKIPKGRWIIGVRSNEDETDRYDDKFYEYQGEEFIRVMSGTTNASSTILSGGFRRYNKIGTAILKANEWYYDVWQWGLHKGKMTALIQVGAKVKVHRDGNMNGKSEEIGKVYEGYYGINYHTNTYVFSLNSLKVVKWIIGGWSAGCQVINERAEYLEQMNYYREAWITDKQEFVTYVLINEFDPE